MSRAGSLFRNLGTLVKRNNNQLCDCMTTEPARLAGISVIFQVIMFAGHPNE